ncbi:MAG TPA: hypothetical protein VHX65_07590 [Pirellulales bacterium]|jgi:hypothetical protein|nr:hypothetical protein [Pirellulales bacterium]
MAVQEIDEKLVDGLKQAKGKRLYFALVLKGGTDGALMIGKQKIPPAEIADAKKRTGGSALITGACFGEDGKLVFEVAKLPAATVANAVKNIAKHCAGQSVNPEFRLSTNPDVVGEGAQPPTQTGSVATDAKNESASKGPLGPLPDTQKYEAALQTWEEAAAAAMSSVDKLVSSLEATGDDLALGISGIIQQAQADFPDTVDDALTGLVAAAKAGRAPEAEMGRNKSEIAIKAALAYLGNNAKTFDGCENNPFGVAVQIRAPLTEALKQVLIAVKK